MTTDEKKKANKKGLECGVRQVRDRRTLAAAPSDELKQEFWFVRFLVTGDRVDRWIKTA